MSRLMRNGGLIILLGVILFHLVNNIIWQREDGYGVHGCHSVWHEKLSIEFSQILQDENTPLYTRIFRFLSFFQLTNFNNTFTITNYSFINALLIFPFSLPIDGHITLALIQTILYVQYLAVIFSVLWLGSLIWNANVGAWAAIVISFYPGMVGLSRKVNVVLLTTLCVIGFVIFLLQWKKFNKVTWALWLGVIFILGVLSSPLFFAYGIPLLVLHTIYVFVVEKERGRRVCALCLFLILFAVVFHFYIGGNYAEFYNHLGANLKEAYEKFIFESDSFIGSAKEGLIESFLYAPQDSVCPCTQTTNVGINLNTFLFYHFQCMKYISIPFFIIGFISFFIILRSKTIDGYTKYILCIWLFGGYILLSVYHIKWGKFCTPLLPLFSLGTAYMITQPMKWLKACRVLLLVLGISVTIYYSYYAEAREDYLEKLTEGLVAHKPVETRFVPTAESVSAIILNASPPRDTSVNIAFFDKDSLRFRGPWVTDMSLRVGILISTFLSRQHTMEYYWSFDEETKESLTKSDFVIVIAQDKILNMESYLFPDNDIDGIAAIEIMYDNILEDETILYLIRIQKESSV